MVLEKLTCVYFGQDGTGVDTVVPCRYAGIISRLFFGEPWNIFVVYLLEHLFGKKHFDDMEVIQMFNSMFGNVCLASRSMTDKKKAGINAPVSCMQLKR